MVSKKYKGIRGGSITINGDSIRGNTGFLIKYTCRALKLVGHGTQNTLQPRHGRRKTNEN